jgi:hypothetical protein
MIGVAADLIIKFQVDVTTSDGQVLGDPYWTEFTDLENVIVTNVPLPDVTQNTYADTDTYRLSLVNPDIETVSMVFQVTGTLYTGVAIECYLEEGEVDTLWAEGNNYAILMGNAEHPDSVDLYFGFYASWDAAVGPLGDSIGFRFMAYDNPIIPFALSADPITQGPGVELQDVATGTMQTIIDFGTITPDDPIVVNEDYLLYGLDHVLVQYAWTGLPADVHIAVDWSDDLGSTWNTWAPDVDYDIAYEEELYLQFTITADAGSDHSSGLAVGLVLTESVAPVIPFSMDADITKSGGVDSLAILTADLTTVLTMLDFGTITQGVPMVYTDIAAKCVTNSVFLSYTWTVLPSDVIVVMEYSTNGGSTWNAWAPSEDTPLMYTDDIVHIRFTITADGIAEYPAGLTATINFHAG